MQLVGAGLADPACATVHAPLALLPVPYPRETFLRAKAAALAFNAMIDAVARDEEYLTSVLAAAAQEDPFTVSGWAGERVGRRGLGWGHAPHRWPELSSRGELASSCCSVCFLSRPSVCCTHPQGVPVAIFLPPCLLLPPACLPGWLTLPAGQAAGGVQGDGRRPACSAG